MTTKAELETWDIIAFLRDQLEIALIEIEELKPNGDAHIVDRLNEILFERWPDHFLPPDLSAEEFKGIWNNNRILRRRK